MSQVHPLHHAAVAARAGNPALAKIHLQKAAEADPDDPAVWLWMGWLSDSPLSMIQCLETLLDNEQYRDVAEAGLRFARTLVEFRPGEPPAVSTSESETQQPDAPETPVPNPPSASDTVQTSVLNGSVDVEPAVVLNDSVNLAEAVNAEPAFDGAGPVAPTEVVPPESLPVDTLNGAPLSGSPFDASIESRGQVPEILFDQALEDAFDEVMEERSGSVVLEESRDPVVDQDVTPSIDGMDLTDDERQLWAGFLEPGVPAIDSREPQLDSQPTIESEPNELVSIPPEQIAAPAVEPDPEPVKVAMPPPDMFRPARADWFSPDGSSDEDDEGTSLSRLTPAVNSTPPQTATPQQPGQPQWARPASSFDFNVEQPAVPANETPVTKRITSMESATLPSVPQQPANRPSQDPPPVWQQPSARRAPTGPWDAVPEAVPPSTPASHATVPMVNPTAGPGAVTVTEERTPSWATAPPPEGNDPETNDPSTKTILIVDDSPTVRKLVAMTLEKRGYRVVTAFDGVAAIKEIAAQRPSLILIDVAMPRLDGYQLCKLVKKHDSTSHIPVVMLSGKDGVFDRLRGRLVGCAGSIAKPFVPEALVEVVERYLSATPAE